MLIIPVILAGGSGTRLWPLSRPECPKQFLRLYGEHSLLQNTLLHILDVPHLASPIIACNASHTPLVREQLHEINIRNACLITEPVGRNTAPAIGVAAMQALRQSEQKNVLLLVLPADHIIDDVSGLHNAITSACKCALQNWLVCFGVPPTRPETGYGYIKYGTAITNVDNVRDAFQIDKFVEKPELQRAEEYLQSGNYYWNSGMFMFSAQDCLRELKQYAPDIFAACCNVMDKSETKNCVEGGRKDTILFLAQQEFALCRSDSIDYAVMEHASHAAMVKLDVGWSDIGSWLSLWEHLPKDQAGNVFVGNAKIHDCTNTYINAQQQKVVAIGVENVIIVEANGVLLVLNKDKCQDLKKVAE